MNINQNEYAANISSIREAHNRIQPHITKTPVLTSHTLNSLSGLTLSFKCECFQKGGAFKFRGACNAIFSLTDEQAAKGVVTHSSGNHAAALSLAAQMRGIPAYIVVPRNAPKCKVENVIRYGGQIIWSEPTMQSREATAARILQETGAVLVHPYNNSLVIGGQGTVALELLEQVAQLDTIIVPISGGGLISGVSLAAKAINPSIRVIAAEPKGADDAAQSKAAGRIITLPETHTIADGLRACLGDLTWPVVRDLVDGNKSLAPVNTSTSNDQEEEVEPEQPSSPSLKKTQEEGIIVVYEVKCKLYVKSTDPADKDNWKDKGMGNLSIKCIEGATRGTKESKPIMVVRNDVGRLLLNALIYPGIKTNLQKNSIVAIFHTSDDTGNDGTSNGTAVARTFLIRTKTEEDRDKLAAMIQECAPPV